MIVDGVSALSTRVVTRICTTCVFPTPVTFCYDLYQYLFTGIFERCKIAQQESRAIARKPRDAACFSYAQ